MSFSSTQSAPAQRVPAWKRLGLKLKSPASGTESGSPTVVGPKPNGNQVRDVNAAKRKRPDHSISLASDSPFKKARNDDSKSTPTLRKQKSVTFTDDTKRPAIVATTKQPAGVKGSAKNKTKAPKTAQPIADINPALDYLRQWRTTREAWKFNKNHQTILMKRVFEADSIPSDDIDTFYEYIRDLKGYIRTRLRDMALEIKKKDVEDGPAGFPEGTKDAETKQSEYELVILGLMQLGSPGMKRKHFNEVEFVAQSTDARITQRVIKRMRAEMIVDELSDSENSDATSATATGTTASSQETVREEDGDKRVKLNDGSGKKAPRRRNLRTNLDDDTSSDSSGESEVDDTSSSSEDESDEEEEDDEMELNPGQDDAETSSSSESSSDGEADSEEDDDEDDEDVAAPRAS